ncbi:unnamed protein product [Litomosoides sigmodontis]|uniref:Uncharacterized protein n=1 Tax=Litomosoides sigmodontis TaxID=42156 RepID=A0A3P6T127_LITSI|nr:unnamed protein product [Litomosoides sigmodontis]
MGDKYEVLNKCKNDATRGISTAPDVLHAGSPVVDVTPLLDPEVDLLKSTTDHDAKKFPSESGHFLYFIKMQLLTLTSLRKGEGDVEEIDYHNLRWRNDNKYYCIQRWYNYWLLCFVGAEGYYPKVLI